MYLHINSEQSREYYPDNTPSHFHVVLDDYINFAEYRLGALLDFTCSTNKFKGEGGGGLKEIYIDTNFTEEQLVGGRWQNLLRYCTVKRDKFQVDRFELPYYVPFKPIRSNTLEIIIRDVDGQVASFLEEVTKCTFHFKKRR